MMTEKSVQGLVSGLINKGCQVGPLARTKKLGIMGDASCLAALKVRCEAEGKDKVSLMMRTVKSVLDANDAHYFSVIIRCATGDSTAYEWAGEAPGTRRN